MAHLDLELVCAEMEEDEHYIAKVKELIDVVGEGRYDKSLHTGFLNSILATYNPVCVTIICLLSQCYCGNKGDSAISSTDVDVVSQESPLLTKRKNWVLLIVL